MYKLCYFVPETHVEQTKQALFDAGAGRIGDYDCCAWQCLGQGQFRPLEGSDPFLGKAGAIEAVDEYKVELVCALTRFIGWRSYRLRLYLRSFAMGWRMSLTWTSKDSRL